MDDKSRFSTIVKWAGLMALIAIPVVVYMKSRKVSQRPAPADTEETDIYSAEPED